ncbi:helix-turn-helix transcriptional regulator [Facklamia sp. P13064]|uniref:helix-turn-helix transcriptional regulator n=1 Tax=Facklamia sp. P13064 TaxID=3421953 RepID=UPI003D176622
MNKLSELRSYYGYSQSELAKILNTNQQTISRWELGVTIPKPYQMQMLEDLFKVDKEDIFFNLFNSQNELKVK